MCIIKLTVDDEFKRMTRPLRPKEYLQLESNLIADGCTEPIITWNGIIVDGHNRYEICCRHNIPFRIKEMDFDCRESVVSWICSNQIRTRNISLEAKKYLIGIHYLNEKVVSSKRNARGIARYTCDDLLGGQPLTPEAIERRLTKMTSEYIAKEYSISTATVYKYGVYAKALIAIAEMEPELFNKVMTGNYKISHNNIVELSKRTEQEVKRFNRKIDRDPTPFIQYKTTRNAVQTGRMETLPSEGPQEPSVKDMPTYDPDAEVAGLTLTIPSWASSIERTKNKADFSVVSMKAKMRLIEALFELKAKIEDILIAIKED